MYILPNWLYSWQQRFEIYITAAITAENVCVVYRRCIPVTFLLLSSSYPTQQKWWDDSWCCCIVNVLTPSRFICYSDSVQNVNPTKWLSRCNALADLLITSVIWFLKPTFGVYIKLFSWIILWGTMVVKYFHTICRAGNGHILQLASLHLFCYVLQSCSAASYIFRLI